MNMISIKGRLLGLTARGILLAGTLLALVGMHQPSIAHAAIPPPPGPDRAKGVQIEYSARTWWLTDYGSNRVVCVLDVDHEGFPTNDELYNNCDPDYVDSFIKESPCYGSKAACEGYYLFLAGTAPKTRTITITLPAPAIWLSLEDCEPVPSLSTNICSGTPMLVLTGQEFVPDQRIVRIAGTLADKPFDCKNPCKLALHPTPDQGSEMQFWGWSSYGDSTTVFQAKVRVARAVTPNPDQSAWYADVLSGQWRGTGSASCSAVWGAFPPVGGPPEWLTTPRDASSLSSDIPYNYLSANLIMQGTVNAGSCPDGGLLPGGGASACGQEVARPQVAAWQNQFDRLILGTAQSTGVPAQLLKNLFARESQFWPGVFRANPDAGLGQLTTNGADSTLLWNPSFFDRYCPMVLSSRRCARGYAHLYPKEQKLLREALVGSVNATCKDCALGIDLSRANFSVGVFAQTLVASCEQTAQVVYNTVGELPGQVANYEDLWKMTLVNYNAGPGCLSLAANEAWQAENSLSWDALSRHFTPVCAPARDYVNDISR